MNTSTLMFFGVMIIVWVMVVVSTCLIPFFSRKNAAFGISVPESEYHNEFFTKLRLNYFATALIIGILLGVGSNLAPIWLDMNISMWIQMGCLLLYLIIAAYLYLTRYFKVKSYKQNSNWEITQMVSASLTVDKNEKKLLSAWWFLSYAVIIVATFVAAVLQYPYLPDQIPMHYNIAGEVDRYVAKSIATFSDMPIMQLIIGLLFVGIYFAILRAKTQSNGGDTEEGLKRDRRFKTIMANFIFFIGFTVMLIFGFVQFSMLGLISISLMSVFTIVFLVVVFAFLVFLITRVGQGGNRMRGNKTSEQTTVTDDDSNWIFGFLYCNKNDPSLFVEKRYGMGYTINFGSPISWVVIIAFVALIAALVILPFVLH